MPLPPTLEINVAVVEKHNANIAPVVLVHDPGARVDKVLDGQARAGGHPRVGAGRRGDGEIGLDDALAPRRNDCILRTARIFLNHEACVTRSLRLNMSNQMPPDYHMMLHIPHQFRDSNYLARS